MTTQRKEHWEKIYTQKQPDEVSWYRPEAQPSVRLIEELNIPRNAAIIDVGGGDSYLAERLLEKGYNDLSVLDISQAALHRAQQRIGEKAAKINWIYEDITLFQPRKKYDVWHDRAVFHFLTDKSDIQKYINTLYSSLNSGGYFIIGTFSTKGPLKCSGLEIRQYSAEKLENMLQDKFEKIKCFTENHQTPFGTEQNFIFCVFKKVK